VTGIDRSSLGGRVFVLREERGMSRALVAKHANVSYAFVQQLETGVRKDPGVKNLSAIAGVLGVSVDSLLSPKVDASCHEGLERTAPLPARKEIDAVLDDLSPEDLVAVRQMLQAWARRVVNQGVRGATD
jgi:transcriptional regulator with XRE-family HTH domain